MLDFPMLGRKGFGPIFALVVVCVAGQARADGLRATISTRNEWLLGEPVVLDAVITNTSTKAVKGQRRHEPYPLNEVKVFIQRGDGLFERFETHLFPDVNRKSFGDITQGLKPGGNWSFQMRLLYDDRSGRLAFTAPGAYRIKIVYPPVGAEQKDTESNVVTTRVKPPQGTDSLVWQKLRRPEYLRFLQTDGLAEREIAGELVAILEAEPNSAYAVAIRHSLTAFLLQQGSALSLAERTKLRRILSIADLADFADGRLAHGIDLKPVEGLRFYPRDHVAGTVKNVLATLSRATDVPLTSTETLTDCVVYIKVQKDLRGYLEAIASDARAYWRKDGNGYYLTNQAFTPSK